MSGRTDPTPRARHRWIHLGEWLLLTLLWVMFMQPARLLAPGLDASWQMMLGYAHDHGLQFGRDVIPTVGPAGFLIATAPAVHHFGARFAWMFLGNGVLALAFWQLGRSLGGWRRLVYFTFLLLLLAPFTESMHGLAILVFGLGLLRLGHGFSLRAALMAAAIGVLALFKFTHFTLAAVLVAIASAHGFYRHGWRRAAATVAGFALGFAGGWKVLGQPLSGLPEFLRLSADISRGYVDAMSLFETPRLFWWGLTALLASGFYAWAYWRTEADRPRAHATVLMLAATWFLNWRHGFVRADAHTLTLFLVCLFPVVAFPNLTQETATPCKHRRLALIGFLSLAGIWTGYAPALTQALPTFYSRLRENLSFATEVRHPREFAARARAEFAQFALDRRLPRIMALVGANTVDVLGTEQSLAMFDNFNYTPRPIFQDYYAYTPRLIQRNTAFYVSARAPQFVLQKYQTIDGRVPGLDDARVLALVYAHYALIAEENGWLLWEKKSPPTPLAPVARQATTIGFGQEFAVPPVADGALWIQIDVQPSLLGRLQEFFYKPPQLTLAVTDTTGSTQTYRMVRAMAADGFLLQPFLPTQAALSGFFAGRAVPRVRAVKVTLPEDDLKCFSPRIVVSLARLSQPAPISTTAAVVANPKYRMFSLAPTRVTSPHPSGPYVLDGHEVFFIHAPGEMEFDPDIAITRLSGSVGMPPGAYSDTNKTDGIEISIEHFSPTGKRTVLWHRLLDPANLAADRGLQPFTVALPGKGRLILKNLTGPKNDPTSDWTLWADLRFE